MTMEAENEMSEPIKLYRNGEVIETYAPSVAREWQTQGWSLTPLESEAVAPVDVEDTGDLDDSPVWLSPEPVPAAIVAEHWAGDMINYVEPEPAQEPVKRPVGRPKKAG